MAIKKSPPELLRRFLEMLGDLYLANDMDRARHLINKFSKELEREQSSH